MAQTIALEHAVAAVFSVTLTSRLLPGPAVLAGARYSVTGDHTAAASFLAGLSTVDATVFLLLAGNPAALPARLLSSSLHLVSLGLIAAGLVILTRADVWARRAFTDKPDRTGDYVRLGPFAAGLVLAVSHPGRWAWWVTFGLVATSASRSAGTAGVILCLPVFLVATVAAYGTTVWVVRRGVDRLSNGVTWLYRLLGVSLICSGAVWLLSEL